MEAVVLAYVAEIWIWDIFNCKGRGDINMLWTIFVILMVLWLLVMVSSYTIDGYIHILLIIAIAVVLIRIIQGRKPF
jgi:uncharacterized protein DUF5670